MSKGLGITRRVLAERACRPPVCYLWMPSRRIRFYPLRMRWCRWQEAQEAARAGLSHLAGDPGGNSAHLAALGWFGRWTQLSAHLARVVWVPPNRGLELFNG